MEKKSIVSSIGLVLFGIGAFLPKLVGDYSIGPFSGLFDSSSALDIALVIIGAIGVLFSAVCEFIPSVEKKVFLKVIKVVSIWILIPEFLMACQFIVSGGGFALKPIIMAIGAITFVVGIFLDSLAEFFKAISASIKSLVARF